MKVYASICTVMLLFHLAVCFQNSDQDGVPFPTQCCLRYISRPIPLRLLSDYYKTSDRCSLPAIVFITKRGRFICANPEAEWVQDRVISLEQN